MERECSQCRRVFAVAPDELEFLPRMAFTLGGRRLEIPPPVECPECRLQIRTAHRNEENLYHRTCDRTGRRIVSLYAPDAPCGGPYTVYGQEHWHADGWDALAYGRSFDFSRSFFEQFSALQKDGPRLALVTIGNENSPFTTGTGYCKNCYLINCSEYCENCYYGKLLQKCCDCIDCAYAYDSTLCCQCFDIHNCYGCTYLSYSRNSADCWFCEDLIGCSNCLFCANLRQKEYHIHNKRVSRTEFAARLADLAGSYAAFESAKRTWHALRTARLHKYANIVSCENCTGDFISGSKNCIDCYDVNDSEDCRWVCVGVNVKDVYDSSNVYLRQELDYQMLGTIDAFHCAFSIYTFHSRDVLYSDHIYHSADLFGCCGLKRKRFCILNRQYSEVEYGLLAARIVDHMQKTGEWGRFFPARCSPFAYKQSLASQYQPLEKSEALARGWYWRDEDRSSYGEARDASGLPDRIEEAACDICTCALRCITSGAPYRIIQPELDLYRRRKLPVPRECPRVRHKAREALRNRRRTWARSCARCQAELQTSFEPGRKEVILCERCYEGELR